MFKKLKDKTKEAAATATAGLVRSDSMNSLNSTSSAVSATSSTRTPNRTPTSRIQKSLQGGPPSSGETRIRQLEAKLAGNNSFYISLIAVFIIPHNM